MSDAPLRLYVPAMDAVLVEFRPDGSVRFEGEGWSRPTLQETRAILHAALESADRLRELIEAIERPMS